MSNINPMQFLNSFINGFNAARNANLQNRAPLNDIMPQMQQNNSLKNILPQTTAQLNQTAAELKLLNQQQTANMLKDLLKFPRNFEQLLTQLETNPQTQAENKFLLLLASNLDLSKLSNLLKTNSKEAMSNLYTMLAQFNQTGMVLKDEQLSKLSRLITFAAASASSDVQTLKTTMLMYLPWLPLTDPDVLKMEIANKNSGESECSDDYISVLTATQHYGNLQADIYKTNEDGIKIQLISSETFPQEDFIVLMKEESKKYSININLDMAQKKAFNKDKNEIPKTQIYMNISPGVNPFLLLIANSLIKNIHIIDDKENLREQRKEKINNGKN